MNKLVGIFLSKCGLVKRFVYGKKRIIIICFWKYISMGLVCWFWKKKNSFIFMVDYIVRFYIKVVMVFGLRYMKG